MRRSACAAALGAVALVAAPASALAVPDCTPKPKSKVLLSGLGSLEAVIVDAKGRLFYSATTNGAIMRVDRPGAQPKVLAAGVDAPGGLAFDDAGMLLAGYGDSVANGAMGALNPKAGVLRIDPDTGAKTVYAAGTQMSNGIARDRDGTVFASNDTGGGIDRIAPGGGSIQLNWSAVPSANGMAIDSTHTYLFSNVTFQPAKIVRVPIAHPETIETYAQPGTEDSASGLDGMTIDARDRLFVAANSGNAVWRVDPDRRICSLADGIMNASAVALGHGSSGFAAGNAYAVGFSGTLVEIPGVTDAAGGSGAGAGGGGADTRPPVARALRRAGRVLRFSVDEAGTVRVDIRRRRCVVSGAGTRRRRRCTVHTSFFRHTAVLGANRVALRAGRLLAGSYRVAVTPSDATGNRGVARRLTFTVR